MVTSECVTSSDGTGGVLTTMQNDAMYHPVIPHGRGSDKYSNERVVWSGYLVPTAITQWKNGILGSGKQASHHHVMQLYPLECLYLQQHENLTPPPITTQLCVHWSALTSP